jgi:hypothetical protein
MKLACILPLTIVLASTSAIGQDLVLHSSPGNVSFSPTRAIGANCPVGLQVSHGPSFLVKKADYGPFAAPQPEVQEQRIHLTMTNHTSREIVKAQITVHGFSDNWKAIPLADASPAPDLEKSVYVALNIKRDGQASRDLSLSRFTSVTAVDLNSLTYADGSTWQSSTSGACSVAPDLLMLVSAAR